MDDFADIIPGSVQDRIIGSIYGHALGDAVGLNTEFKFKCDNHDIQYPYTNSIRNFPICDWTDDTDHLILVMMSLTENNLIIDENDIANKLSTWVSSGFKELGDTVGLGLGGTMNMVITHPRFLEKPIEAASEIWFNSGKKLAANGSLMRTSILGTLPNAECVISLAAKLSMITHADPRCIASCVLQSAIIHEFCYNVSDKDSKTDKIDKILSDGISYARKYIETEIEPHIFESRHQPTPKCYLDNTFKTREEELSHWIQTAYTGRIASLRLDDTVKIGYVYKCLACSIYALQVIKVSLRESKTPSFKKFILKVAAECGDADTNCAVAGSVLGSYLGYSKLPKDWIDALPNRLWLNQHILKYLSILEY